MKEVNVDLLVIGNIVAGSFVQCLAHADIACSGGEDDIRADCIPDSVVVYGVRYILRGAIVMDAKGKDVNINSLFVPKNRAVFASGHITALGC